MAKNQIAVTIFTQLLVISITTLLLYWLIKLRGGCAFTSEDKMKIFNVSFPFNVTIERIARQHVMLTGLDAFKGKMLVGIATFLFPGAESTTRERIAPWHVFFGVVIFSMAILSAETGLTEKFIFQKLQKGHEALACYNSQISQLLAFVMAGERSSYRMSAFPVTILGHLLVVSITTLLLVWLIKLREGFAFTSEMKIKIFNLHPLLTVLGFVVFSGEVSVETGITEKFMFQHLGKVPEALVINFIGLLILLFGVTVGLSVVFPLRRK
ncbi:probable ascorbate-specific transmembrane electron transporter 1 [Tanacetum coccineum]